MGDDEPRYQAVSESLWWCAGWALSFWSTRAQVWHSLVSRGLIHHLSSSSILTFFYNLTIRTFGTFLIPYSWTVWTFCKRKKKQVFVDIKNNYFEHVFKTNSDLRPCKWQYAGVTGLIYNSKITIFSDLELWCSHAIVLWKKL